MTVQMFAFAVLLVSVSAHSDQCVAGNTDNSDTFDAIGLLQSNTKIILQADRDKIANDEVDEEAVPHHYVKEDKAWCRPSNPGAVGTPWKAGWTLQGCKDKCDGWTNCYAFGWRDSDNLCEFYADCGSGARQYPPGSIPGHHVYVKAKVKKSEAPGASKKGSKKAAVDKAAKAAKQAAADKAVADASTSLRTDLKELTSTKEDFEKELKTLETHIAQTETAAQAVKSMAKNAADEMAAALKAVKKAKDEESAAKDKEAEELAKKHKLHATELLKTAEGHKADADKAIKDLGKHQKLAKDAEVARKKEAANKDNAASTAAQELAKKTQEAANLAKAAAATAKVKAAKAKVAADVAAR